MTAPTTTQTDKSRRLLMSLCEAALKDDVQGIQNALRFARDLRINIIDEPTASGGETVLMRAAAKGHTAAVKALVDDGAAISIAADKKTALMFAVENGRPATIKVLVKKGANVNEPFPGGKTPLMVAVESGYGYAVQALVEAGADIDAVLKEESARTLAIRLGHQYVGYNDTAIKALFTDWAINAPMHNELPPLIFAVQNGYFKSAQMLIDQGADANVAMKGKTALELVVKTNSIRNRDQSLGILIAAGADVKSKKAGKTVLDSVSKLSGGYQQNQKTVLSLVAAGADSKDLQTPGFFKRIFSSASKKDFLSNVNIVRKVCREEKGSEEDKEISNLRKLKEALIGGGASQVAANLTIAAMVDEGVFRKAPERKKSTISPMAERGKFYDFLFLNRNQNALLRQIVDSYSLGKDLNVAPTARAAGAGIGTGAAAYGVVGRNTRAGAASRKVWGAETDAAPEVIGVPAGAGTGAGDPKHPKPLSGQQLSTAASPGQGTGIVN